MSYNDRLASEVDQVRRHLGDVQDPTLFSDNEIRGYLKNFSNFNEAIGRLFLSLAGDPVMILVVFDRQDGRMTMTELSALYQTLGRFWLGKDR